MQKASPNAKNVRLLVLSGVGPVIGVVQTETSEHFIMTDVAQFVEQGGDAVLQDYMQGLQNNSLPTVFLKSNIVSVGVPDDIFLAPYLKAITPDTPALIVPEQKIITKV